MTKGPPAQSFRDVFERHRDPVHRMLWRLTGSSHDADDLLQETFVTYWRKRDQFRGEGSLAGYLKRIAYRTWLNSRDRLAAKNPPLSLVHAPEAGGPGPEGETEERDSRDFLLARVREALRAIPDGAREAFVLFRFEGMTVAQVAEVTDAPLKTVESRLKRATEHVARRLSKYRDQLLSR